MDLRQLRYFAVIVRAGSLSSAARELGVAQPALSQHLQAMELRLGIRLLERSNRGVVPTAAGRRLDDEARNILAHFDGLEARVRAEGVASGRVVLGMPGTISEQIGIALVERVREAFPMIRLRVAEAMSGHVRAMLHAGQVDLALLLKQPDQHGMSCQDLLTEEIVLFATPTTEGGPPTDSMKFADAMRLPLILPGSGHALRDMIDASALVTGDQCHPALEIDSYRQIVELTLRGRYFALLPFAAVEPQLRAGRARVWRVREPDVRRTVTLARLAKYPMTEAQQCIARLIFALLHDLVERGSWRARWDGNARLLI